MAKVFCLNGGWLFGTEAAFPMDPRVSLKERPARVPCNQLYCSACDVPVKHMDGVREQGRAPGHLGALFDSTDPADWLALVDLEPSCRLYYCRCSWYSTPGITQVGHLDSKGIDGWGCAGHPADGAC
jgi:hypothetical protein